MKKLFLFALFAQRAVRMRIQTRTEVPILDKPLRPTPIQMQRM